MISLIDLGTFNREVTETYIADILSAVFSKEFETTVISVNVTVELPETTNAVPIKKEVITVGV